ncbi:MAG TPA: DUF3667 domain-containing protein [Dokdonella sp.]
MTTCTNCGAVLSGAFCQACGQRRFVESDRRLGSLLHQFIASATDLDGRVWRSLRALLFQPGLLSREYFIGRRARWISPISLFLAANVAYFLAPLHGSDVARLFNQQVSGQVRALAADPAATLSTAQLASTGPAHTAFTTAWIDARVRARDAAARKASHGASGYGYRDYRIAYDARADDVSKALILLHVPFTALVLMLLFVRQHRYFAEHFVVALHFFTFALVSLQIVMHVQALLQFALPPSWMPPDAAIDGFMRVLFPLYAVLSLRRAYAVGWLPSIGAAAAMLAAVVAVNLYVYRAAQFMLTFALT